MSRDARLSAQGSPLPPRLLARLALLLLAVLVFAGLLLTLPAEAQDDGPADAAVDPDAMTLEAADERPLRGSTVRLTVHRGLGPAPGARVTAIYRPNSTTSVTEELTPVDASGTLMWTPLHTGPVTLEVRPATAETEEDPPATSRTLAVRYGGMPASGLLIMVLAGVLLFGGAAISFYLLLKAPAHTPAAEPPST